MTTFRPQQSGRVRCASKKAYAGKLQIRVTNCAAKLHNHFHEARKIVCNNLSRAVQARVMQLPLYAKQALPLVKTRFLRLANSSPKTARSPARLSRDGRETSGEMSRARSAQRPGNGRTVATAMPPNIRPDDSQDNLRCAGFGRAMSAWKLARQPANWPRNSRETSRKMTRQNPTVMFLTIPF